jgi:hypothetical protein
MVTRLLVMVTRLLVMVTRLARHGDEHGPYRESSVECGEVKTKGASVQAREPC